MDRQTVIQWFEQHVEVIAADPTEIVEHCERAVRRHAREDAWLAAKAYVSRRRRSWERTPGLHASEAYTAHTICRDLAAGLRSHEPRILPEDAEHLAGGPIRRSLDAAGWDFLTRFILDLARNEEHVTWEEIVQYTGSHARDLVRDNGLSDDCSSDGGVCFGEAAARISRILERDFAVHAFPH